MELRVQTYASNKHIVYAVPRALVFSAYGTQLLVAIPSRRRMD